jgi:hypothetical protein
MRTPPPARGPNRAEAFLGRSAALCAHPVIAWGASARFARARVVAGYFALGYLGVMAGLMLLS